MKTGSRKALVAWGGPTRVQGDASIGKRLEAAWEASREDDDTLTHGFHAYPARMHGGLARALLASFGTPGGTLLDPFCGSGTTLVEARVAGMAAVGVDLNPVALHVATTKCELRSPEQRERFRQGLARVVEASLLRVRKRIPARAPLSAQERQLYDAHVLLELAGLLAEIETVTPLEDRRAMKVLLSAIVVKFSRQRADTTRQTTEKRIGKGVPTRFWGRKGEELVERWAALAEACRTTPDTAPPRILEGDARELATLLEPGWRADAVITSPPYGGTYDYARHHARRYPWLGVAADRFERQEIGARRRLGGAWEAGSKRRGGGSVDAWNGEVLAVLKSLAARLAPQGWVVWVMGDGQIGRERVPADRQLRELAPRAGLGVVAVASQERPDWRGGEPRAEHLIAMRRA